MIKELSKRKSSGVIFHKIDRSTRNHSDWSKLIDLRDFVGIKLFFSADGIDMNTRSGRFVADINVAMAKHYIDNLREEVLKGLYGRLKQGIYPFKAPIGYLDRGGGKVKEFDPRVAPIIREVFRLCAEEGYSIKRLIAYLADNGVTSSTGKPLGKGTVGKILHNPFYMGVMKVKSQTFIGKHQKLITSKMFHDTQNMLSGKRTKGKTKHDYLYRKTITCNCGVSLIAEKQKGRVYYRCQNKECLETTIREDRILSAIENYFNIHKLGEDIIREIEKNTLSQLKIQAQSKQQVNSSLKLQLSNAQGRLNKLTDYLLSGSIDEQQYLIKKENLHMEIVHLEDKKEQDNLNFSALEQKLKKILELSTAFYSIYISRNKREKRLLLKKVFSNLSFINGKLVIEMKKPFSLAQFFTSVSYGGLTRDNTRKVSCQEQIDTISNDLLHYLINKD